MKIRLSNQIEIQTTPDNVRQIIEQFTFSNPKYQDALSFGRSTHGIDRYIYLAEQSASGELIEPIGPLDYLLQTFNPEVIDQRTEVPATIPFSGTLRPYQETFVDEAIIAKVGVMVAATGSGKTVCGIAMAARLKQRTLILVKSKDLAGQWCEPIKQFTGLDAVPCWVEEMNDDAYMELVKANNQGELLPIEIGIHALATVTDKTKKGGGIRAYANEVGKGEDAVKQWVSVAKVYSVLCDTCSTKIQETPPSPIRDKQSPTIIMARLSRLLT